jgi:hypothetical protein
MLWDLARDACIFCDAGEFPFTISAGTRLHPCGSPCDGDRFHVAMKGRANPARRNIIIGKLNVWRPMTLASIISLCDDQYWKNPDKSPTLSDIEYDRIVEQLRNIAPDHPKLQEIGK